MTDNIKTLGSSEKKNDLKSRLLIVEDDPTIQELLKAFFEGTPYEATIVKCGKECLDHIGAFPFDVLICDLRLPDIHGLDLLKQVKKTHPMLPFIVMTADHSPNSAVNAMKMGAEDYLLKPFDTRSLFHAVENALQKGHLLSENFSLRQQLQNRKMFGDMIGLSPAMQKLFEKLIKVGNTRATVLIFGESGTGKELIARTIHNLSDRKSKSFVAVNCGAVPKELQESAFFGHVKGAFTGAVSDNSGYFRQAHTGTLFLDEIASTQLDLQVKLLRVLEDYEIRPVGGSSTFKTDIRIIAAANENLKELVHRGEFREDLFYRLKVVSIDVPPLRDRKGDIPLLAVHFLEIFKERFGRPVKGFHPDAITSLLQYHWPGNIRELENRIEQAVLLTDNEYLSAYDLQLAEEEGEPPKMDHFLADAFQGQTYQDAKLRVIEAFTAKYLDQLLQSHDGILTSAAKEAGMQKSNLSSLLKKYNLNLSEYRAAAARKQR